MAVGDFHVCGLRSDDSLQCWGNDGDRYSDDVYGQVSGPNAAGGTFTQIGAGGDTTCALSEQGWLRCWGANHAWQVSGPNADPGHDLVQVTVGVRHVCALRTDGTGTCWGCNSQGQALAPGANPDDAVLLGGCF